MKIAFNVLSVKAGAGVSVFQMLMPAIAKLDKENDYYIIVVYIKRSIGGYNLKFKFKEILRRNEKEII
jgi:O-antigen/teichoic acid export membrane protein